MSLADRLESRSERDPETGCVNWVGGAGHRGWYGVVTRPGGGQVLTHRASWEVAHGSPVPVGKVIRHKCDNGLCINPDHLEIGEQGDNMHDMHDRDRGTYGEHVHNHKLTAADIPEIRRRIADGETLSGLAREYGVWPTTIHDIATGKTWTRVK